MIAPAVPVLCIDTRTGIVTRYHRKVVRDVAGLAVLPYISKTILLPEHAGTWGSHEVLAALEKFRKADEI